MSAVPEPVPSSTLEWSKSVGINPIQSMGSFSLLLGQIDRVKSEDLPRYIRRTDHHTLLLINEGMKDGDRKDPGSLLGADSNYTDTHLALNIQSSHNLMLIQNRNYYSYLYA